MGTQFRQHFFIGGRYLGYADRVSPYESLSTPRSVVYVCASCGEVYARCPVESPLGGDGLFYSVDGWCNRCPATPSGANGLGRLHIPGSLFNPFDHTLLDDAPRPVVLWELEQHLDYYERESAREFTNGTQEEGKEQAGSPQRGGLDDASSAAGG